MGCCHLDLVAIFVGGEHADISGVCWNGSIAIPFLRASNFKAETPGISKIKRRGL